MIAYAIAVMLVLFLIYRHFGPDRRVCVQCGGFLHHKRGCPAEKDRD